MSDPMITALVSAGGTLIVSIVTLVANAFIEGFRNKSEMKQKDYQSKREHLNEVYKELISIINLYPNSSPNDILKYIDYAPNYSMEHFDSILQILDYQIEDYKKQLNNKNIKYEERCEIDTQISNREYAKQNIFEIRDEYYMARDKYKSFCESNKVVFDLYAGQDVRNCLVKFEVVIHNVFISGHMAGDKDDPINNIIQISRRNLINSIRNDIGIH